MKENKVVNAMSGISDKYIDEATAYESKRKKKTAVWVKWTGVMAACLCVIIGIGMFNRPTPVDSVVEIDVNPSVKIEVSKDDKVIKVVAGNEDAKVVLEGLDLKAVDLDVALNAIIGSMATHGYLDDACNSVNICVKNDNIERGEKLGEKIKEKIHGVLEEKDIIGEVESTACQKGDDYVKKAKKYRVSLGKLLLAEKVVESTGMTLEEATKLSISELWDLADAQPADIISKDAALEIAVLDAGKEVSAVVVLKNKIMEDEGEWTYKIAFSADKKEIYCYKINAIDGTVLERGYEVLEEEPTPEVNENPSVGTATENTEVSTDGTDGTEETTEGTTEEGPSLTVLAKKNILSIIYKDAGVEELKVRLEELKLKEEDGQLVFEVEFKVGKQEYEYVVNAYDGTIIEKESEEHEAPNPGNGNGNAQTPGAGNKPGVGNKPEAPQATITQDEALNIVYTDANVTAEGVTKLDVKFKSNIIKTYYRIKFSVDRDKYDYTVDATNGEILTKIVNIKNEKPSAGETTKPGEGNAETMTKDTILSILCSDTGLELKLLDFHKFKLTREDDKLVFEIKIKTPEMEYEYKINAVTGEILDKIESELVKPGHHGTQGGQANQGNREERPKDEDVSETPDTEKLPNKEDIKDEIKDWIGGIF